jgi:hypothetical protein
MLGERRPQQRFNRISGHHTCEYTRRRPSRPRDAAT